jgi:2-dehydro-3-deoxygluconokinase
MNMGKVETDNRRFDLVWLGECLVELRREPSGLYSQSYAGDVFNSLFYASRLGLRTGFISQFGSDQFSSGLNALCDREAIDHSICTLSRSRHNGLYTVDVNAHGDPAYTFWRKGSAATQIFKDIPLETIKNYALAGKHFLFSAIGLAVFDEPEQYFSLLKELKGSVKIHFDMNVRPALWDDLMELRRYVERLAEFVDVIFGSIIDNTLVFGKRTVVESLDWYRGVGYPSIIVRRGKKSTYAWNAESGEIEIPALENMSVVDATGAGDAFNAGYISMSDAPFTEAVRFGNICGALALGVPGALGLDFRKEDALKLWDTATP